MSRSHETDKAVILLSTIGTVGMVSTLKIVDTVAVVNTANTSIEIHY